MTITTLDSDTVTVAWIAKAIGVTTQAIYIAIRVGKLKPIVRLPQQVVLIARSEAERYMRERRPQKGGRRTNKMVQDAPAIAESSAV